MHKYFAISVVLICTAYNCVSQTTPSQNDLFRVSRILHDYHGPSNRTDSIKFDDRLEVVLANDSVIRVKGALTTIDEGHFFLKAAKYKPNKGKIKPRDTKEISRYTYSGLKITGIATDSCWLFKVETGRINSYSYYPDHFENSFYDTIKFMPLGYAGKFSICLLRENEQQRQRSHSGGRHCDQSKIRCCC